MDRSLIILRLFTTPTVGRPSLNIMTSGRARSVPSRTRLKRGVNIGPARSLQWTQEHPASFCSARLPVPAWVNRLIFCLKPTILKRSSGRRRSRIFRISSLITDRRRPPILVEASSTNTTSFGRTFRRSSWAIGRICT